MTCNALNIEQALLSSLGELVRYNIRQRCSDIDPRHIPELEQRLLQIGFEVYAPSVLVLAGAGSSFSDKSIAKLISFEFIDSTFQKIITNKISYIKYFLKEAHAFATRHIPHKTSIITYKFAKGDSHNLGKETIFFDIAFDNSVEKFIFKPTCSASQRIINEFIINVTSENSFQASPVQDIVFFKNNSYCIKKFIKQTYIYDEESLYKYFFHLGTLICISLYTKAEDLHFENVISSNCLPYIIDGEIILDDLTFKHEDMILNSGILQYLHYATNNQYSFTNIEVDIRDNRLNYAKEKHYHSHTISKVENNSLNNKKNIAKLCEGFTYCFNKIKNKKEKFIEISNSILNDDTIRLRYITRFTSVYKITQLKLWTPFPLDILERKASTKKNLSTHEQVKERKKLSTCLSQLVDAEMIDLEEGDIPFFWINHRGALCHRTGTILQNYKETSPAKQLSETIQNASQMHLKAKLIPELKRALKQVSEIISSQS